MLCLESDFCLAGFPLRFLLVLHLPRPTPRKQALMLWAVLQKGRPTRQRTHGSWANMELKPNGLLICQSHWNEF